MSKNIEINIQTTANTYETLYPKTLGSLVDGAVSLATNATNATNATSASQATKLSTARTIRTNLSSTSTASFDGTSNITPGIYGTLSVSYGGTGVTSYSSLASNLSSYLNSSTNVSIKSYIGNGSSPTIYFDIISGKTIGTVLWIPPSSPITVNNTNYSVDIGWTIPSASTVMYLHYSNTTDTNATKYWNYKYSNNTFTFKSPARDPFMYVNGETYTMIAFYN